MNRKLICRVTLILLIGIRFTQVCAQGIANTKIFGNKNLVEFGNTFMYTLDKYQPPFFKLNSNNLFWGYTRVIYARHHVNFSYVSFNSPSDFTAPIGRRMEYTMKILNLSYGYNLHVKWIDLIPHAGFAYRYDGGESTVFGYRNPGSLWSEPLIANLRYQKPFGILLGVNANYFLTPHIGFGLSANYYYFPFENVKLSAGGVDQPSSYFVETFKPLQTVMTLHAKVIVRL